MLGSCAFNRGRKDEDLQRYSLRESYFRQLQTTHQKPKIPSKNRNPSSRISTLDAQKPHARIEFATFEVDFKQLR